MQRPWGRSLGRIKELWGLKCGGLHTGMSWGVSGDRESWAQGGRGCQLYLGGFGQGPDPRDPPLYLWSLLPGFAGGAAQETCGSLREFMHPDRCS